MDLRSSEPQARRGRMPFGRRIPVMLCALPTSTEDRKMRLKFHVFPALAVIGMGTAALLTTPDTAHARRGCTKCVYDCPNYPDVFCLSYDCPAEGASCSATSCGGGSYTVKCPGEVS